MMKLPKEYRKYAVPGGYEKCKNGYGRKMLRKFGFGPGFGEAPKKVESPVKSAPKIKKVEATKPVKKAKKTTKKED